MSNNLWLFRTEQLKKSIIQKPFIGIDWAEILSVLKYGNFHVVNEVLMYIFEGGASTKGMINISVNYNPNFFRNIVSLVSFYI